MPDPEYPELVEEIRNALGVIGEIDTLSRSLTWRTGAKQGGRTVSVTVRPRAGRTRIRVQERVGELAGELFGGIMGGLGGGGGSVAIGVGIGAAGAPVAVVLGLAGLVIGSSYGLARVIFTASVRSKTAELTGLIDRLAEHVAETSVVQQQIR